MSSRLEVVWAAMGLTPEQVDEQIAVRRSYRLDYALCWLEEEHPREPLPAETQARLRALFDAGATP